jgi:Cu/Ag efflux protein CusF
MRRTFLTISLLLCSFAPACGTADPPTRRYHARGQVTAVNGSGPDLTISIHHEQIDNFEDRDGKRAAMPSMVMAFGVAPELPRDLWGQGKKLAFDFDVRWSKQPTLYIVKADALPADAALTLTSEH